MQGGVIVVCRMNSSRLPGKTLAPVQGQPLLGYVWSRLLPLLADGISLCVATSREWFDEPIAEYCASRGIDCFRGDCDDVAGRLLACAHSRGFSHFARVNGDSPFVEAGLIRHAFSRLEQEPFDFVTNLSPRSYPYGVAVEAMSTRWYAEWMSGTTDPLDREHVTRNIYPRLEEVRYANLRRPGKDLSQWTLTIDTPEHLRWFRQFVSGLSVDWRTLGHEAAIDQIQRQRRAG